MRSDSGLLILIFRSDKRMGLLMQSDFTKSDGMKYDLKVRWPKSSDFGPSDDFSPSDYQIENGIDLSSRTSQTEQSRPGTAAV